MEKIDKLDQIVEKEKENLQIKDKKANNLMDLIIGETFARHKNLDETDYLKAIGFENSGKTEDEAVRIAIFNVLTEATKALLKIEGNLNIANGLFKTIINEESLEDTKNNEKND